MKLLSVFLLILSGLTWSVGRPDTVKAICLSLVPKLTSAYKCVDSHQDDIVSKCIAESLAPQPTVSTEEYLIKACDHQTFQQSVDEKYQACTRRGDPQFSLIVQIKSKFQMPYQLENANPNVYEKSGQRVFNGLELDDTVVDDFDSREIYDLIRGIKDPEHPLTLEELNVLEESNVEVNTETSTITVHFTPTINHCSMATLIGLTIVVKLLRCLPSTFKIDVRITKGKHATEDAINKQLNDKERVSAALENPNLLQVINQCLIGTL